MEGIPDDDRIGKEIAAAHTAPTPEQVSAIIVKNLFDRGTARLSNAARFVAVRMIAGALEVWQRQLAAKPGGDSELEKYKKAYKDTKEELENIKLRLAVLQKEGKLG